MNKLKNFGEGLADLVNLTFHKNRNSKIAQIGLSGLIVGASTGSALMGLATSFVTGLHVFSDSPSKEDWDGFLQKKLDYLPENKYKLSESEKKYNSIAIPTIIVLGSMILKSEYDSGVLEKLTDMEFIANNKQFFAKSIMTYFLFGSSYASLYKLGQRLWTPNSSWKRSKETKALFRQGMTFKYSKENSKELRRKMLEAGVNDIDMLSELFFEDERFVESLGYVVKQLKEDSQIYEKRFLEKDRRKIYKHTEQHKEHNNLFLFGLSLPMGIEPELKDYYAKEALKEIINNKYDFNTEEKSQLISSIALYFSDSNPEFAKEVWQKYIEVTKEDTELYKEFTPGDGTSGMVKRVVSKQRDFSPRDHAIHVEVGDERIIAKRDQNDYLKNNLEDSLGVFATTLYTGDIDE